MKTQLFALNQVTSDSSNIRWWLRMIFILLLLIFGSSIAPGQTKEWDKTFGGSGWDQLHSLQQTSDGGYILGGLSMSDMSGDKTEASRGGEDYWVVKLDAAGEKAWDRTFGGRGTDNLSSLEQTNEGGISWAVGPILVSAGIKWRTPGEGRITG